MTLLAPTDIDTVAVAVPDGVGRFIGKRIPLERYDDVLRNGLAMPDFHLVTGLDNVPFDDLEVTGPHTGFCNGLLRPDPPDLRQLPWLDRTALAICDAYGQDDALVEVAPRAILRRQIARLADFGVQARAALELEFYLFRGTFEHALLADYRDLRPSYHLPGDHDLLVSGYDEELIGEIRRSMPAAGVPVEVSQGEGGPGQHEICLAHAEPIEAADRHAIYKHGVREISTRRGMAPTFMAKVDEALPGSSCHIHLSLSGIEGNALGESGRLSSFGAAFLAGVLRFTAELMPLHAPYANSYKRLVDGSWAPSNLTWGYDNRTVAVRLVGTGPDFRLEFRVPGADANAYLSLAGLIAAGVAGVARDLVPPPPVAGDGYGTQAPGLPLDLGEAIQRFADSDTAAEAMGPKVHRHVLGLSRHEFERSRRAVTDWDRRRGFERA